MQTDNRRSPDRAPSLAGTVTATLEPDSETESEIMAEDPFATPAPISSTFASAQSFKGRLVLIQPTKYEMDVPNYQDPSKSADRVTATVTTVDGQGPVQIFSNRTASGKFLEGPEHKGVWFGQERIVQQVAPDRTFKPGSMVLARIDTRYPDKGAGVGNPWGLLDPTEQDKQLARDFLANRIVGQAAAPAAAPADENPFGKTEAPF